MFFTSNNKEQQSSIKCVYPPGGQSNFQFSYKDAKPDKINCKKYPDTKMNYDIVNLQDNGINNNQNINMRNCSIKTNYNFGKEKFNIFKNEYPKESQQSSIKVTQKPGGFSCVQFAKEQ